MALQQFPFSPAELNEVTGVQFSVLGPDELRALSVAQIDKSETYLDGVPVKGGLSDPRMGPCDKRQLCETCNCDFDDCPGHFGHIELAQPMFNISYLKTVLKVLRCVCYHCSELLCNKQTAAFREVLKIRNARIRLNRIKDLCNGVTVCGSSSDVQEKKFESIVDGTVAQALDNGCGQQQPVYRLEGLKMTREFKRLQNVQDAGVEAKQVLPPSRVYEILKNIDDRNCRFMGLSPEWCRPENMILTVLPVPPPYVRPSVEFNGHRNDDELTHHMASIIKMNNELRKREISGAPSTAVQQTASIVQHYVCTCFDNDLPGVPQSTVKSGRPIKAYTQRLKGKDGRVRQNLMGKRVDFSARSVITADPNISIDEVGVPRSIAMELTVPETVNSYNIKELQKLVEAGPDSLEGAKYIVRGQGERFNLRFMQRAADTYLDYGYVVERHLRTGDVVVFNRQPSLHKMSMMAHQVRVMPYSTFRLNLSCTTPYNADFDGDEMNLHVPQSYETMAECREIMMVPRQIVTPQANRPVMGIVQDALLGCKMFTLRDTFFTRDEMMNLLMWVPGFDGKIPVPALLKPRELWTGKQIFSLILPIVNLRRKGNEFQDDDSKPNRDDPDLSLNDSYVQIIKGRLVTGSLDKSTMGNKAGSLIHVTFNECGPEMTKQLMNEIQYLVNSFMLHHGYTIGVGDTVANEQANQNIRDIIERAKNDVEELVEHLHQGKLEGQPGKTIMESFEEKTNEVLNKARNDSGKAAYMSLPFTNNIKFMVSAGSKGNSINVAQICACVGQVNVGGLRIPYGFKQRTLPHFHKDDLGPESRGFVQNSYYRGLTPHEFFYHAMGGREGLIDTAVKTAETGYIQRRLIKAMEQLTVHYDGTVRNAQGEIVQFLYGEDGLDGMYQETQTLDTVRMSDEQVMRAYHMDPAQADFGVGVMEHEVIDAVQAEADAALRFTEELREITHDRRSMQQDIIPVGQATWPLPVNLGRLIENAQRMFNIDTNGLTDLNPLDVVDEVKALCKRLRVVGGPNMELHESQQNGTLLFQRLVRCKLASRRVVYGYRLSVQAFAWVMGEVEARFQRAVVFPGEMVGAIAAQSLGEPATQMTLNTFHLAGVSESRKLTEGVPRLKEILNVAKQLKTPSCTVYLRGRAARDAALAKAVQTRLEFTTMSRIVLSTQIYYDPDPLDTVVEEDREWVEVYNLVPDETLDVNRLSPWLLRIEFDREMVVDKKLAMDKIAETVEAELEGDARVIASDDNADHLVLRIRLRLDDDRVKERERGSLLPGEDEQFIRAMEEILLDVTLLGVSGVRKVYLRELKTKMLDKETWSFKDQTEWVLDTDGTNLRSLMALDEVDYTRTISNDIMEMFGVLGIEAARASVLAEMRAVIAGQSGNYVNYRHMAILADVMSHQGLVMPITRHGINRMETGALARCSFEETVDILRDAAAFAEMDPVAGVSESILLGKLGKLGTGSFDVLLDDEMAESTVTAVAGYESSGLFIPSTPGMQSPGSGRHTPFIGGGGDMSMGTPSYGTPMHDGGQTPMMEGLHSPGNMSPFAGSMTPTSPGSGYQSPASGYQSPGAAGSGSAMTPQSPGYTPQSPGYSPTSPGYTPQSPGYSPTSPGYTPTSPGYSPTSPGYTPTSPGYSPTSPGYSPTSPGYSPTSPGYSPTSPGYSPTSPGYSPTSPGYSPTSPGYSPTSPSYSPTSPSYSPASPSYSPASPSYSPASPGGGGGGGGGSGPAYGSGSGSAAYSPASPTSPTYSPDSPSYSPPN